MKQYEGQLGAEQTTPRIASILDSAAKRFMKSHSNLRGEEFVSALTEYLKNYINSSEKNQMSDITSFIDERLSGAGTYTGS